MRERDREHTQTHTPGHMPCLSLSLYIYICIYIYIYTYIYTQYLPTHSPLAFSRRGGPSGLGSLALKVTSAKEEIRDQQFRV